MLEKMKIWNMEVSYLWLNQNGISYMSCNKQLNIYKKEYPTRHLQKERGEYKVEHKK